MVTHVHARAHTHTHTHAFFLSQDQLNKESREPLNRTSDQVPVLSIRKTFPKDTNFKESGTCFEGVRKGSPDASSWAPLDTA